MKISLLVMWILLLTFSLSGVLYINYGIFKRFFHDILHWHEPNGKICLNGINLESKCKYCGKEIIQDSQGNWF